MGIRIVPVEEEESGEGQEGTGMSDMRELVRARIARIKAETAFFEAKRQVQEDWGSYLRARAAQEELKECMLELDRTQKVREMEAVNQLLVEERRENLRASIAQAKERAQKAEHRNYPPRHDGRRGDPRREGQQRPRFTNPIKGAATVATQEKTTETQTEVPPSE